MMSNYLPEADCKPAESKALVTAMQESTRESLAVPTFKGGSIHRDLILANLNQDKVMSLIQAWEKNRKARSVNRYNLRISQIASWEIAKQATAEAKLKQLQAKLEQQKATCEEEMKNAMAWAHRMAEERRAIAKACHGEEIIEAEERAAKLRAARRVPRRRSQCLGI